MQDHIIPYLAGLFDGEGSLILTYRNKKDKKGIYRRTYVLYLSLSNTDKSVLNLLKAAFGGSVCLHKEKNGEGRIKANYQSFSWIASNWLAYIALKALYPFLVIKKEEADQIIPYMERNARKGIEARTHARWNRMEEYQNLMAEIHQDAEETRKRILEARSDKRERIICGIT